MTVARCFNNQSSVGLNTSRACVVCACVCDLSLSLFLFSLRSDGSNVCYFFYTWPCLCGSTYQRRLVGASLPLPACLPVWSSLVWSNACRQPCVFLFVLFFSFLSPSLSFLSYNRHGWIVPLPFFSVFYPTSSLCVHHHYHHHYYPFC